MRSLSLLAHGAVLVSFLVGGTSASACRPRPVSSAVSSAVPSTTAVVSTPSSTSSAVSTSSVLSTSAVTTSSASSTSPVSSSTASSPAAVSSTFSSSSASSASSTSSTSSSASPSASADCFVLATDTNYTAENDLVGLWSDGSAAVFTLTSENYLEYTNGIANGTIVYVGCSGTGGYQPVNDETIADSDTGYAVCSIDATTREVTCTCSTPDSPVYTLWVAEPTIRWDTTVPSDNYQVKLFANATACLS